MMALNNIEAVGDDQKWKAEVERQLKKALDRIAVLERQLNSRSS
jgi:hypothetical protein